MASRESFVSAHEAQSALARVLLERLREDKYPSYTHMQILEQVIPRSLQREYLSVLLEKVIADSQPSITMLRHILRLAQNL
jgi:hypothetical protein